MLEEIVRCIRKCGKYQNLLIPWIDRMLEFMSYQVFEIIQLAIMCWCDFFHLFEDCSSHDKILQEVLLPSESIHICEIDFDFISDTEVVTEPVIILFIEIYIIDLDKFRLYLYAIPLEVIDTFDDSLDTRDKLRECDTK